MDLTKLCLKNPAAVGVVLALIALLGVVSITKLPIQLLPNIERPELGIWTGWRAASPREVESEIIEPIERELRGIPGLKTMQSFSNSGGGNVDLSNLIVSDSANGDGVSISQDGVTWYRVLDATNVESDQWARVSIDLMAAVSSAGIALD
ncbi:MAG: efflux RND transporter permease subunit, partial [Parvularculaceae bacterium]|nr:efflux RND transporter permease subunit [Parvularculaceae bacterium]